MHRLQRLLCVSLLGFSSATVRAQSEYDLKLSLDPLLVPSKAWALTAEAIDEEFKDPGFKENPFVAWSSDKNTAKFSRHPFANISVALTALDDQVPLSDAQIVLDKDDHKASAVILTTVGASPEIQAKLRSKLAGLIGGESKPGPRPALGWKSDASIRSEAWTSAAGSAVLQKAASFLRVFIGRPGSTPLDIAGETSSRREHQRGEKLEFFVRLDQLLPVPALWSMTPDMLDERISAGGLGMKDSPFFKWSTTTRESARFSKDLFSNTKTDVLLFDDAVNAEEVNIDFNNGKVSKLVVTLLTRGNSGNSIGSEDFDKVFKATGRALGAMLGVRPQNSTPSGKALIKTTGYLWTTPHTLALMEFNVDAPMGKVEFLRLTLTPAAGRAQLLNLAGIGGNATTRSRDSLLKSVKRDKATGDVEITGVPMRDQGQKGYCVAASCERLFRYLGQPCDMDELAKLVSADAEKGASPSVMYGSLAKIDQQYNMRVKLVNIPPGYGLGPALKSKTELEHAQKANLARTIQENVDAGLPLLWCVLLDPGSTGVSPQPGQQFPPQFTGGPRVGHMRLITGYNSLTHSVIYTDSWGAGHERKVMSIEEAKSMTTAVFSMAPSR